MVRALREQERKAVGDGSGFRRPEDGGSLPHWSHQQQAGLAESQPSDRPVAPGTPNNLP